MSSIICKNCDHHFKGNFCPQCGQSAKVEPIDVKYFLHDIPHSILHVDKGFFYTLGKLISSPGPSLKNYLEGKRVKYFRPFAFVLIMSTISTLLIKLCDSLINLKLHKINPEKTYTFGISFFSKYPSLLIFILIPLLSFITWVTFIKRKYNYWEHFLVNTYLAAYLNVFFLIINVFSVVKFYVTGSGNINYTFFMFFFMAYYAHAFGGLLTEKGKFMQTFLRLFIMDFFLATIYMTAFSFTGIMTPWWGK
jgi:hypothetical protein